MTEREAAGEAGAAETGEPRETPEAIRDDIEQTREDLGSTVEALSHKADVKGQVREKVDERKEALREKVGTVKEQVTGAKERASSATPEDAKRVGAQVVTTAKERPGPAIGVALGAGIVVGWLIGRR